MIQVFTHARACLWSAALSICWCSPWRELNQPLRYPIACSDLMQTCLKMLTWVWEGMKVRIGDSWMFCFQLMQHGASCMVWYTSCPMHMLSLPTSIHFCWTECCCYNRFSNHKRQSNPPHDSAIHWPLEDKKEKLKQWMEAVSCCAWQDGYCMVNKTPIVLFQKPGYHGEAYFYRKSNYSLNLQVYKSYSISCTCICYNLDSLLPCQIST